MSDTPNFETCNMDVGCQEHEKCFAAQNGSPENCGAFGPVNGNKNDTSLENWFPYSAEELNRLERENAALRAELDAMKAATYSHVDGRDLLHELQPNGAHHIDILVRINGQDRRYQGDWLKTLTWARDGHNMGEYADNPRLRALIEQRLRDGPQEVGECSGSIDAAIRRRGKP